MLARYILFSLLISIVLVAKTQTQQQPVQKMYKAPDGKLYINKKLPVYLFLSTSADGSTGMQKLESDSTKAFANPMYFDTEGYNTFRSPSAVNPKTKQLVYPITDVVFEVYADSRAPHTKTDFDPDLNYVNKKAFGGKNIKLSLVGSDALSGVENTFYSINNTEYKPYTAELTFDTEGNYIITYYSVDNVGNIENVNKTEFNIDITPPATELVFDGGKFENIISGNTKLKLVATDQVSGVSKILFSIDNKKFQTYSYPIQAQYYTEGEHIIKYYAVDKTGNTETEHEFVFFIDKTPPILVDELMGNSYNVNGREYSSGRTKLKLTAVDNKAGIREIKYSINNQEYQVYEKPFYLTSVSGQLSVQSYCVDNVGNKSVATEKSTRSRAAFVDLTGPQLKHNFIGKVFITRDTIFINKDTKIQLLATDPESGVKNITYSLNNNAEQNYTNPFNITTEGVQTLNIYGYDNVDNSNRSTVVLVIDNQGPDIYNRFSILPIGKKIIDTVERELYLSHAVLFLSATDTKVAIDKIYYSVNGSPEKLYTGIIDNLKRGMDYKINVKAYDKLGNLNQHEIIFATDNTGPEIGTRFSVTPVNKTQINGEQIDVYPAHVSLFLSVINAPVAYDRIFYSINGSKEKLYQGIIDGFAKGSQIKMHIRAVDKLGNQTSNDIHFVIE